jgi:hypothetical protein
MKFMKIFAGLILGPLTSLSFADSPYSIDRETGKYLGNLSTERYDPNSTSKPYGRPVITYSPDSINNPYGEHGSQYPNDLYNNNPYATDPPRIMHDKSRGGDRRDVYDYYSPGDKILLNMSVPQQLRCN